MSFATLANIATAILCAAVLVQSVRMMRSLKAVRADAIAGVIAALDHSTAEARGVLFELKAAFADCTRHAAVVTDAKAIADELTVMVGIANASADRMADTANAARREQVAHAEANAARRQQAEVLADTWAETQVEDWV